MRSSTSNKTAKVQLTSKEIKALLNDRPLSLGGSAGRWELINIHSNQTVFKASNLQAIRDRITLLLGI